MLILLTREQIKCDETKPSCLKCGRSNVKCPGYDPVFVWSTKHEITTADGPNRQEQQSQKNISIKDTTHQLIGIVPDFQTGPYVSSSEVFSDCSILAPGDGMTSSELAQGDDAVWKPAFEPDIGLPLFPSSETQTLAIDDWSSHQQIHFHENAVELGTLSDQISWFSSPPLTTSSHNAPMLLDPRVRSPLTRPLVDYDSILVEYYFYRVATLYSCFDGNLNPFRTAVSRMWNSSEVMTLTLQSLAAACLAKDIPYLAQQGISLRSRAITEAKSLMESNEALTVVLLCLIMLGQTASWHDPSDLGISQFCDARKLYESQFIKDIAGDLIQDTDLNLVFFEQALSYWNMVLSFTSDVGKRDLLLGSCDQMLRLQMYIIPHPWAIIAPDLMTTIAEVGHLIYRHRKKCLQRSFWQRAHTLAIQDTKSQCSKLESSLFHHKLRCEAEIVDPGDECTPVSHFVAVAKAYQLCALLQIYRVFPDILDERNAASAHCQSMSEVPFFLLESHPQASDAHRNVFLQRFALNIIKTLAGVPLESHTRSIQAFLYVALSSELYLPVMEAFQASYFETVEARHLVQSRLEAYRHIFAPQPAQRKLDIVLKVWKAMDGSSLSVYWMDVMIENSMEVVFC